MSNLKTHPNQNATPAKQCGGGKPDRAQAGNKLPDKLEAALNGAKTLI